MRKIIALSVLTALIAGVVSWQISAQVHPTTSTETALERVLRTGVIRCGYFNWPPLTNKNVNTGEMEGIMPDYLRALAKAAGLKVEFTQEVAIDTYLQDLKNGRYDLECAGGWPNAIRAKYAVYTHPIAYYPLYAFVRADDKRFAAGDLQRINRADVKVVVFDGETADLTQRQRFPQSTRLEIPAGVATPELSLVNVATRKADVAFLDGATGFRYMQANPGKLKPLPEPVRLIEINISVAQGEQELLNFLNEATDELRHDGTLEQIIARHTTATDSFILPAKTYRLP